MNLSAVYGGKALPANSESTQICDGSIQGLAEPFNSHPPKAVGIAARRQLPDAVARFLIV